MASEEKTQSTSGQATSGEPQAALYLAEYEQPGDLMHAAEKVRDAGYQSWDCHTPYPVHGMDEAMGLKPTRIGYISFVFGISGVALAATMMLFMNASDASFLGFPGYPIIVGGKPAASFPSMVPIMFELGILLCGLATLFGMLGLLKLPRHHHPIFFSERFARATDDRFFISIEAKDPKFHLESTKKLLESTHPANVELIEEEAQ